MRRIMIIGCCGAGKSTLARALHERISLPLIHLDQHYHLPNWKEPSKEDWEEKLKDLVKGDSWIIDGNYGGTMSIRMARADTIIFMDYPTIRCFWRVLKRIWKYHGQVRPDMPEGCKERLNLEFLHYVATFGIVKRPAILKRLEGFQGDIIVIESDREATAFLENL